MEGQAERLKKRDLKKTLTASMTGEPEPVVETTCTREVEEGGDDLLSCDGGDGCTLMLRVL